MSNTSATPIHVPINDKENRRRAAATVGKAYIGTVTWWVCLIAFTTAAAVLARMAWQAHHAELGTGETVSTALAALVFLAFAVAYLPLSIALTIGRAQDLYYVDTGRARAAMATKADKRRNALPGDVQAHSFGAWPRHRGAGPVLGMWVRDQVHAQGGRLTGTALPGTAESYRNHGMVDDGRTALFLHRVASTTRPPEEDR